MTNDLCSLSSFSFAVIILTCKFLICSPYCVYTMCILCTSLARTWQWNLSLSLSVQERRARSWPTQWRASSSSSDISPSTSSTSASSRCRRCRRELDQDRQSPSTWHRTASREAFHAALPRLKVRLHRIVSYRIVSYRHGGLHNASVSPSCVIAFTTLIYRTATRLLPVLVAVALW